MLYEDALRIHPAYFDALHMAGVLASQVGDHQRSVELIRRAVAIGPDNATAHSNLGLALKGLGRFAAAVSSFDRAIALKPDYANAYFNRGIAQAALGEWEAAVASYDQVVALKADHADAWCNRGAALRSLDRLDAAVASYDRALAVRPDDASVHANRGNALMELKHPDAALASYDRALALKPDYPETWCNRGLALVAQGHLDAAVASYDRALALDPDHADARWYKSLVLLRTGDFEPGWELYESRWRRDVSIPDRRNFSQTRWRGVEPLAGKTIVLHGEQGFGDTIQFCRYARLVAALGARVIVDVPASLVSLMQTLEGVAEVVATGDALPAFDCWCPLLSLPLAFRTDLAGIPHAVPYLRSDPGRRERWAARLGPQTGPRVGIAWSGSLTHANDRYRSLDLARFARALAPGCTYVSLQKEVRAGDVSTLQSHPGIRHFGDDLADYADTAALCDLMDLVISVDTSAVHLAGALGKPVWVLLPQVADWRWLLDRDDSPWYPTARLYRQSAADDWDDVLDRVAADLARPGRRGGA